MEGGYYADPAAECQAFHICANDGAGGLITYRWGLKYFNLDKENYKEGETGFRTKQNFVIKVFPSKILSMSK